MPKIHYSNSPDLRSTQCQLQLDGLTLMKLAAFGSDQLALEAALCTFDPFGPEIREQIRIHRLTSTWSFEIPYSRNLGRSSPQYCTDCKDAKGCLAVKLGVVVLAASWFGGSGNVSLDLGLPSATGQHIESCSVHVR